MGTLNTPNTFSAGQTIQSAKVNENFTAIANVLNGNIEAVNVADATLTSAKFAAGLLAQSFMYSIYGASFVSNGCLVTDSSTGGVPRVTLSAGVICTVADGELVSYTKASDTYSFSGDGTYYLFISSAGVLSADASISPAAGTQTLAKCVVTGFGGTAAVAVTDYARRGPTRPKEIDGLELTYAGTGTVINAYSGYAQIGGTHYRLPAYTAVDIATAGNWVGGSVQYSSGSQWVYVYAMPTDTWLSIKLSTTAPAYYDEYGIQIASHYPNKWHMVSTTQYRCIGAIYTTDNGAAFTAIRWFYQQGNMVWYNTGVAVSRSTTAAANIPAISRLGYFRAEGQADTGHPASILLTAAGGGTGNSVRLYTTLITGLDIAQGFVPTNDSQQISFVLADVGANAADVLTLGYVLGIRD